nr:RNA polymerase sigma factor [uncultured Arsenicibacter sp.]
MKPTALKTITDEELVRLFSATGSQRYFEVIYHRYNRRVYQKCLQITKDEYLAQDYAHDVFMHLLQKINYFEGRSSFSTWLYALTRNFVLTRLRTHDGAKSISLDGLESIADEYGEGGVDPKLFLLPKALSVLSSEEAQLLVMRYYEGLAFSEISRQLAISISAIKMRLNRSRAKLKKQILTWSESEAYA